jgi:hypothetical protein
MSRRVQALQAVGGGGALAKLQEAVKEHAAWLEANMTQQHRTYADFVAQRRSGNEEETGEAGNGAGSHGEASLEVFEGRQPGSVAVAAEENDKDAEQFLEQCVRGVVRIPCVFIIYLLYILQ